MARPTKYTEERAQRITQALADGNTRKAAAAHGGITIETLCAWERRFLDFSTAVTRAEAEAELAHVAAIKAASDGGDWRASVFWLERRRSADWGRVDRVEIELRAAAERIAEGYPPERRPDPDWLVRRAQKIASGALNGPADG